MQRSWELFSEDDVKKQLKEMAQLTVLSGRINELQEKNLSMYPFVFFNGVGNMKIDYDLSYTQPANDEPPIHNSRVTYYLELDPLANNYDLPTRFAQLEAAVRTLFWNDLTVEVYFNDKIEYKSKYV